MNISKENIEALRGLIECEPRNVVVLSHTNPDGDALGSSLAWAEALRQRGHKVTCIVPNRFPYYLEWMSGLEDMVIFKCDEEHRAAAAVAAAAAGSPTSFRPVSCTLRWTRRRSLR